MQNIQATGYKFKLIGLNMEHFNKHTKFIRILCSVAVAYFSNSVPVKFTYMLMTENVSVVKQS